jgi:ferredoxin
MVASTAAIVSPMLLNAAIPATDAKAATLKNTTGKVYFVTTGCNGCHVCKVVCPQKAIFYGDCKMEIDQDKCVQCGTCYEECPNSAISETDY